MALCDAVYGCAFRLLTASALSALGILSMKLYIMLTCDLKNTKLRGNTKRTNFKSILENQFSDCLMNHAGCFCVKFVIRKRSVAIPDSYEIEFRPLSKTNRMQIM